MVRNISNHMNIFTKIYKRMEEIGIKDGTYTEGDYHQDETTEYQMRVVRMSERRGNESEIDIHESNQPTSKHIKSKANPSIKNIGLPDPSNNISNLARQKISNVSQMILSAVLTRCIRNEGIVVKKPHKSGKHGRNLEDIDYIQLNATSAFISPHLIRGISGICQLEAMDNKEWKLADSIKVVCNYLDGWAQQSYNFYCKEELIVLLNEIMKVVGVETSPKSGVEKSSKSIINNSKFGRKGTKTFDESSKNIK